MSNLRGSYGDGAAIHPDVLTAIDATEEARASFIMRTYVHLFMAVMLFTGIQVALFKTGAIYDVARLVSGNWLLAFGAFMVVSWLASNWAHRAGSGVGAYIALILFVAIEAVIFSPLLFIAANAGPSLLQSAVTVTAAGFLGLTGVAFVTRKDFSFLRGVLMWGGICALVAIGGGLFFGWQLGLWFSVAMVAFAGAAILYDTSQIIHRYPTDRHVAASLQLFASVALLFWYVLQIFLDRE